MSISDDTLLFISKKLKIKLNLAFKIELSQAESEP